MEQNIEKIMIVSYENNNMMLLAVLDKDKGVTN